MGLSAFLKSPLLGLGLGAILAALVIALLTRGRALTFMADDYLHLLAVHRLAEPPQRPRRC